MNRQGLHWRLIIFFNVSYKIYTKVQFYKLVAHGVSKHGQRFGIKHYQVYGRDGGVLIKWPSKVFFTITAEILVRSLANFYCQ